MKILASAISITLLTTLIFLFIGKSSIFNGKKDSTPTPIFSDDGKNITDGMSEPIIKENNKTAVPDKRSTSSTSRKVLGIGDGKSVEELLKEFSSMDNDAKINLVINLEYFQPELLDLAFSDKSVDVRLAAVKSLAFLDTDQKNILPFITLAMNDGSGQIRDESYKIMDSLDDKSDVLSLIEPAMNSKFPDARLNAVSKFIDPDIPREDSRALVMKALSDKDKEVREQALLSASFLWDQDFGSEDEAIKFLSK